MTLPSSRLPRFKVTTDDIAFAVVVIAGLVTTLFIEPQAYTLPFGFALFGAGLVFLLIGVYGLALFQSRFGRFANALYFFIQIPLGFFIMFLSHGSAWLVLLPLVSQSVFLDRVWTILVSLLTVVGFALILAVFVTWQIALQSSILFFPAVVFVIIFSEATRSAHLARADAERLAKELNDVNDKLREYASQVEELATTKERNRLAREIHDGLGHYLTAINIQIEAARAVFGTDQAHALDALGKAQSLTKEGLAEVRRSVAALRSSPIENRPLREALTKMAEEYRATGIVTEFVVIGTPRPLSPQIELALYRAAEESLTNIRKHAHATRADITLDYSTEKRVCLKIQDNGIGANILTGGFGLVGVRERTQLLGGDVRIDTAIGKGFSLRIEVPE